MHSSPFARVFCALLLCGFVAPHALRGAILDAAQSPAPIEVISIEEYDTTENSSMRRLYSKLAAGDSLVRIAFLGDSFVEADILTADLRELLQSSYGGCGVGYVPLWSPLAIYRPTIKTTAKGWSAHNIMQYNKSAEPYKSRFGVGGWISQPTTGATTLLQSTSVRDHIDSCERVRLHFIALDDCRIAVSLDGGVSQYFNFAGGDSLQQLVLEGESISSVELKVLAGAKGFLGYGALFEGRSGVVVDNYSVRSNNGRAMLWSSPLINSQIDSAIGGYDLVILQYGLNIMQSGVNRYTAYGAQIERMIEFARQSFPSAAILVMGVSDRWIRREGRYVQMRSEALGLTSYQRQAAQNQEVCFWDTFAAMQCRGGMSGFVAGGFAAKDHTHINTKGGRQIAEILFDALAVGVDDARSSIVQRVDYDRVISEQSHAVIQQRLARDNYIKPMQLRNTKPKRIGHR